ncbi:hypothetical protein TetV_525 [Tetraselmis virus 1]|uniref:Uncharacterized protein n=1 Tax=Tetraselmis virus 1 TaxID=2060617 RepID=A0A2P0VNY0_9VIRU|nr:hypothetical protein QJ968_gp529 [Tetraselmis virus 1]AUF82607.1 hypothetical protein TetV_525 [Tetraselmis virus 1]
MGVYCFKWNNGPWFKVGHYSRLNPWSRFAKRGWNSVIVPDIALHFSSVDDFDLVFWNQSLKTSHEKNIHKLFEDSSFGEWYPEHMFPEIMNALLNMGTNYCDSDTCNKQAAKNTRRRL